MSSMSEFVKPCIYPKTEIKMSNKSDGRWLPYDFDLSAHDCKHDAKESVNDVYTNNSVSKMLLQWRKGLQELRRKHLEILNNAQRHFQKSDYI